jgi:beta-phosphoglucomutase-like phosphatase (HAD superfamily)
VVHRLARPSGEDSQRVRRSDTPPIGQPMPTRAIIFDLDGLLVDSEPHWQAAETAFLEAHGHLYDQTLARQYAGLRLMDVIGVMQRECGIPGDPGRLAADLLARLLREYDRGLGMCPGADTAIRLLGGRHPLAIASSSPLEVIRFVTRKFGWDGLVAALCSAEEVPRGKPAPDVFFLAATRLGVPPEACCVFEDSPAGLRAARAAGMRCIAVPTHAFGTAEEFASLADLVLASLTDLQPEMVEAHA